MTAASQRASCDLPLICRRLVVIGFPPLAGHTLSISPAALLLCHDARIAVGEMVPSILGF